MRGLWEPSRVAAARMLQPATMAPSAALDKRGSRISGIVGPGPMPKAITRARRNTNAAALNDSLTCSPRERGSRNRIATCVDFGNHPGSLQHECCSPQRWPHLQPSIRRTAGIAAPRMEQLATGNHRPPWQVNPRQSRSRRACGSMDRTRRPQRAGGWWCRHNVRLVEEATVLPKCGQNS